jgi:hypothetical protein
VGRPPRVRWRAGRRPRAAVHGRAPVRPRRERRRTDGGENDEGTPVIEEKIVRLEEFDRDALFEAVESARDLPDDTGSVIIRPIEETPFERYTGRGEHSASLGRWSE